MKSTVGVMTVATIGRAGGWWAVGSGLTSPSKSEPSQEAEICMAWHPNANDVTSNLVHVFTPTTGPCMSYHVSYMRLWTWLQLLNRVCC